MIPRTQIQPDLINRRSLDALFRPRSIAVIGATEKPLSAGRCVLENLQLFGGAVYAVNPKRSNVLGRSCYPSINDIPVAVDLAVVVTPAATVAEIIHQCVEARVGAAVIISAGFRETGAQGAALERTILEEARRGGMRILGPNCLGFMNPHSALNASFAAPMARPGHIGLISQSGAICAAILDWSQTVTLGFSSFISVGSMLDVGWGDLIQYLGEDPHTRSIAIYMESIGDARAFMSAAREVAISKPIIVIKPGRTEAAAKAAASHTGALTGQDDVFDAALRRCGVIRVNTIAELFELSEALDKQPRPKGPHLTIVTNSGGPGVLATDALLTGEGQLAQLSANTIAQLNLRLPPYWSHQNPIDILGDATHERFAAAVELAVKDPSTEGLLVVLTPTGPTNPVSVAERLVPCAASPGVPILASWMGGKASQAGAEILSRAGIPVYEYPDQAARIFELMWSHEAHLKALYETPEPFIPNSSAFLTTGDIVDRARKNGRSFLSEAESKAVLASYGIPVVQTEIAQNADRAVEIASRIGYPVVVKLHSETLTHKTEVGGVQLNLADEAAVRKAYRDIEQNSRRSDGDPTFLGVTVQPMIRQGDGYELILGSSTDAQFGPVLVFGSGGQLVEVYRDRALGLPPLNTTLAGLLIARTKIATALHGIRGRRPVDLGELERLLVRFSDLVLEQPGIKEIDINPLLASPEGFLALDARVVLRECGDKQAPKPAIRPYPREYSKSWHFDDGSEVMIRPIRPEDEPAVAQFHKRLSEQTVYKRYFGFVNLDQRVQHNRLSNICFCDFDRHIVLVAERANGLKAPGEILAVARLNRIQFTDDAEMAVLIEDDCQNRGLGTELVTRLIEIARKEKISRVTLETLSDNMPIVELCKQLGITLQATGAGTLLGALALQ